MKRDLSQERYVYWTHYMKYMVAYYPMPTLTKTTLYLPEAEYRLLKALARQKHRPAAALLVRGGDHRVYGALRQTLPPSNLGAGRSGRRDLSEKAEELLTGLVSDT